MDKTITISSYDDVFDILVSDEKEAVDMYDRFARSSGNLELKKMFEQIKQDEMGHEIALRHKWKKYSNEAFPVSFEIVINQRANNEEDYEFGSYYEILKYAAADEKTAEELYQDIAGQISNDAVKQLFLRNARDEGNHRLRLERMMEFI